MYVKNNPISLMIFFYKLDRKKICQDLNITIDELYLFESDGVDVPDHIINYFLQVTNENKNIFKF